VTPDGRRFLMLRPAGTTVEDLHLVLGWLPELEQLAPRPR
jgi:hypothetical protein